MTKKSSTQNSKRMLSVILTGAFMFFCNLTFSQSKLDVKTPQVQVSCNGACDGSITALVSGGTPPYSYLWSNGSTGSSVTGLCAAYYSVTVTDAAGEVEHAYNLISEPQVLQNNLSVIQPNCFGVCNGSISSAVSGGRTPYTYAWSNGSSAASLQGLCDGVYTLTVTDSRGCIATDSKSLLAPDALLLDISSTPEICFQDCEGTANAIVGGGTAPYDYLWSNGPQSDFNGKLCSGSYSVIVSDANGCSISGSVNITGPSKGLTASCLVINDESAPGAADGSMSASGDGGYLPYTYLWSNGSMNALNDNLSEGVYTVIITDAKGCSSESTCEIKGSDCNGQFRTQTQGGWGQCQQNGNNPGTYLAANFAGAFPNGLTVGACGKTLHLSSAAAVCDFLPSGSTPKSLTISLVNPGTSYKNVLAGQLVALTLSVGFDGYDANFGSSASSLGSQIINSGTFAGWSVQDLLDEANKKLGGCASAYSASQLNNALSSINQNYVDGTTDNGFLSCPNKGKKIANPIGDNKLVAYPNPFNNSIQLELIDKSQSMDIKVMDIMGKLVLQAGSLTEDVMLIGQELKPGIYFILATDSENNTQKIKVVKQ